MTSDAAQKYAEIDAWRNCAAFVYPHSDEANIVSVGKNRDGATVVEGDVELAGQFIHITRVGNVGLHGFGKRRYIDKFVRVNAGNRRCSDVANVVGSGAA